MPLPLPAHLPAIMEWEQPEQEPPMEEPDYSGITREYSEWRKTYVHPVYANPLTLPITAYVEDAPAPPEPVYADPLVLPITAWVAAAPPEAQDAFALYLEVPGDTGLTLETPAGDHYFLTIGEQ